VFKPDRIRLAMAFSESFPQHYERTEGFRKREVRLTRFRDGVHSSSPSRVGFECKTNAEEGDEPVWEGRKTGISRVDNRGG
jgi:hypothetical protein